MQEFGQKKKLMPLKIFRRNPHLLGGEYNCCNHYRLLNYPTPITIAEAIKLNLVPNQLKPFPISSYELASVWGYGNENGIIVKALRKGLPWAKGTARDSINMLIKELAKTRPQMVEMMIFGDYPHALSIAGQI